MSENFTEKQLAVLFYENIMYVYAIVQVQILN